MSSSTLSNADLELGIAEGIISVDQAERLKALAAQRRGEAVTYASGDEPFRLFRGFRDLFLAIGIAILASGTVLAVRYITIDDVLGRVAPFGALAFAAAAWLLVAAIAWGFAEWVTRRLRLPLSSIVILGWFAGAMAMAGAIATLAVAGLSVELGSLVTYRNTAAAFVAFFATILFYLRFRLPFALFVIAVAVAVTIVSGAEAMSTVWSISYGRAIAGIVGFAVFLVALFYDAQDPNRLTRKSECGLWLHILAAPLMVHAMVGGFQGGLDIENVAHAARIIAIVAGFGLIALIIDRRTLLAASLIYLGAAVYAAIGNAGLSEEAVIVLTLIAIGAFIVFLGTAWSTVRNLLLSVLPSGQWRNALPPVHR